jgi:hypothetical protein
MKLLIFMMLPLLGVSQAKHLPLVALLSAGYATNNKPIFEGAIGVKTNNFVIYPLAMKRQLSSSPKVAQVFESRISYNIQSWEVYGGYGYHWAGSDGRKEFQKYQGFKPAIGIIYHPFKYIIISAGMSGLDKYKIFSLQIGIFRFK